jgi:hypothetical protein
MKKKYLLNNFRMPNGSCEMSLDFMLEYKSFN